MIYLIGTMITKQFKLLLCGFWLNFFLLSITQAKDLSASVTYRPSQLQAKNVAVVYNIDNDNSTEIAQYYLNARHIPESNLIGVNAPKNNHGVMHPDDFTQLKTAIESHLNNDIQVIVLMWTTPFAVNCNAITAALTLGYNAKQCENTCSAGDNNPYFNSASLNPYQSNQLRLSMLLPTDNIATAKALIDRGVLSNFTLSEGTGYFLKTKDIARSKPREPFFPNDLDTISSRKLFLRTLHAEDIQHKKDVMFYFTGQATVTHLNTLNFLPGAIADHLTSFGGVLIANSDQMPSTKWIEAGATGSFGSVSEPCNYWQKFPNPQVLLGHYLAGETLIESYWKSVVWPTQGLFIGEPLATPYKRIDVNMLLPHLDISN
jgi:uncharacterized protein (TIGR03790 family)